VSEAGFFALHQTIFSTFVPAFITQKHYIVRLMSQRIIYWFRNDLRIHDNEGFYAAVKRSEEVIPVYIFDPRQFAMTRFGFRRAGALRTQFLLQSVAALRASLREKGGDLLIRVGEPEKIIAQMAEEYGAEFVYTSKEIAPDETQVESSLSKGLKISNIDIKLFWMNTLNSASALPFTIAKLPATFDAFYEQMINRVSPTPMTPEPDLITLPSDFESGILPSLSMLGIDPQEIPSDHKLEAGGEKMALEKLAIFVKHFPHDCQSSDLLMEAQLSKWISLGCLSPRMLFHEVENSCPDETLKRALLKRDYFHWTLLRFGSRLFKPSGINHDMNKRWNNDTAAFDLWRTAQTDNHEVNRLITQLNQTGYLTFEERVMASDYLATTLQVNWTWGAMYFESLLIDYSVSNSWCNWNFVAGVAGKAI
jgi:deoxyribodipyrimidine photo-lyase